MRKIRQRYSDDDFEKIFRIDRLRFEWSRFALLVFIVGWKASYPQIDNGLK